MQPRTLAEHIRLTEVSFGEVKVSILLPGGKHTVSYVMALDERMLDDLKPPPDMETERLRAPQS